MPESDGIIVRETLKLLLLFYGVLWGAMSIVAQRLGRYRLFRVEFVVLAAYSFLFGIAVPLVLWLPGSQLPFLTVQFAVLIIRAVTFRYHFVQAVVIALAAGAICSKFLDILRYVDY